MGDKAFPKNEEIDCPFCEKAKISVITTPAHYGYTSARAFGKVKRIPAYHPEKVEVISNCAVCKKTRKEIKEALERGETRVMTHEERLERLRKRGLPLVLTSER